MRRGELSLASFDVAKAGEHADVAEKIVRKLRTGMMPPREAARKPDAATRLALVTALETTLDAAAAAHANPGRRSFQRLNRAEYAAAIRSLFGLDIDVSTYLPADTISASFDNIADVQMPSATVMQGYMRAAAHVSRVAVGDPSIDASSTQYEVPRTKSQKGRVDGAPFGTRGGTVVMHNFPADGNYNFQMLLHGEPTGFLFGRTRARHPDGSGHRRRPRRAAESRSLDVRVRSGRAHRLHAADLRAGRAATRCGHVHSGVRGLGRRSDQADRPHAGRHANRRRLRRHDASAPAQSRPSSGRSRSRVCPIIRRDARSSAAVRRRRRKTCRAPGASSNGWRRRRIAGRLSPADVDELMHFYDEGREVRRLRERRAHGAAGDALEPALRVPRRRNAGDREAGDARIASATSTSRRGSRFSCGARFPTRELIDVARRGGLSRPDMFDQQVRRMLADSRSDALGTRFAAQWLRLQDLHKVEPDALSFPYFDESLADAMARETELLFEHLVRDDRSALELLTADYTFVNERLARHYGIGGVSGPDFRKVSYPDDTRRGLLGHGSVLTLTSHGNRTSPVLRGKWVMEVLLGSPPPPPPVDVPDLEETKSAKEGRMLSVAEQLAQHRASPACSSCHNVIDPIGLSLDNFDVTGAWRIKDRGVPVNVTSELYDGTPLNGVADLRAALLAKSDVVVTHLTERLLSYALGRRVEHYDMPAVRKIVREAKASDYRMSSLILGVVKSAAFRTALAEATDDGSK